MTTATLNRRPGVLTEDEAAKLAREHNRVVQIIHESAREECAVKRAGDTHGGFAIRFDAPRIGGAGARFGVAVLAHKPQGAPPT